MAKRMGDSQPLCDVGITETKRAKQSDLEPLCDVGILKTKRVLLVENVLFQCVMPFILPFLIFRQVDSISGEKTKGDKMARLLDIIDRLAKGSQFGAFNALLKAIGGTQPDLFQKLVERAPTEVESLFCMKDIVQGVKDNIINTDHCTDSELDQKISFEYEHVELSVVGRNSDSESAREVPHEYGDHLTKLQGTGSNISATDILSEKSRLNEKVLVFGRPGVGKSTTTQWLARLWAQGKWASGVTLLFLLQLRFLTNVDIPITGLQLLTLYGLYQLGDMAESLVLSSWLKNPKSRILIFVDGLDEIPGFARRMINTRKICDLAQKALPIDLFVNILRGDLLPHGTVISASRPFLGLSNLRVDSKAEVLGLTSKKVTEYVECRYPEKAKHILSVLERNPILLSVCGITFYCMMISQLLSEGVVLIDEEVQTYTRLMAFILVQYTSRKITGSDFTFETNPYLAKLSNLAFSGIFQSQGNSKLAKLVFDKKDVLDCKLSIDELDCVKKTGIIQVREHHLGHRKSIVAEFFHLSGQEMLAVLHFLSISNHPDDILQQLFGGGHFDMALMYTFGLHFDRTSAWANELWTAMGSTNPGADSEITSQLSLFIDRLWKESGSKMKACQLLYEGQWMEKAKEVSGHIAPGGHLSINGISMTAIDVLAVDFVCRCSGALTSITLKRVNADATFVKVLSSSLVAHNLHTLQELDLRDNTIGAEGVRAMSDSLSTAEGGTEPGADSPSLTTLDISDNELGDEGAEGVAVLLSSNTSLTSLDISYNEIQGAGAACIGAALGSNTSLTVLNISHNGIGAAGAASLGAALRSNTCLTVLDISVNGIGAAGAASLGAALGRNTSLTEVEISDNEIGAAGAASLGAALGRNTSLTMLNISNNGIGAAGAASLGAALGSNTSLTVLNISYNGIGAAGAASVGAALVSNTSLTKLYISYNGIGAAGAASVGAALGSNTSLTELNISDNGIGSPGAAALANMLKVNTCLEVLHVHRNRIGNMGSKCIVAALHQNTSLTELNIRLNDIWPAGKAALDAVSQHRPTLTIRHMV